jgi:MoxR-like ATPase
MSYPDPLPESLRAFMNWRVSWPESDIPARLADAAISDFRRVFGQAEAELAALKAVAEAMEEFIDSCTYHRLDGNTVNYDGPRADDNEYYASELRTAAAVYIAALEDELAAEEGGEDE